MAERGKNTYENIHKQLSDAMQDAYINDVLKDVEEPNIDLSFLTEEKNSKRKRNKLIRIGTVAAVTIIVLLGANIALLSSENIDSYGEKGILHRIYEGINGIFTDRDDSEKTDVKETFEIKKEDDIEKAKNHFPNLYVPKYIPKEYEFESLYIEGFYSGDYMYSYIYKSNNEDIIEITSLHYNSPYDYSYQAQESEEVIDLVDRKIIVAWEDTFEEYYVTVYLECGTIDIGMHEYNDKKEVIEIAKGLQQ